jgi:hypothetical protein
MYSDRYLIFQRNLLPPFLGRREAKRRRVVGNIGKGG